MMRGFRIALRASPPLKRLLLLLVAGGVAIAVHARRTPPPAPPLVEPEITCVEPMMPTEPPAPTLPGPDIYALLDACLRTGHHPWTDMHVEVSLVRYWVEVEHDPAWFETSSASWWLPLSGEGEAQSPSGVYISVPVSGAACGGALVN